MAQASFRVLRDLFEKDLNFTPTEADIARFERDLKVVSPSLMKASLRELAHKRDWRPSRSQDWRDAIYAIYNRKVAEHAQLFPVFHCFETAFRSTLAVDLEGHYGVAQWWRPVAQAHARGDHITHIAHSVKKLGNVNNVPSSTVRTIYYLVDDLTRKKLDAQSFPDGYSLLESSHLGHIQSLALDHWALLQNRFIING